MTSRLYSLGSGTESDSVASMPITFDQALSTLHAARSVRLQGKPAAWSNALRVMFYILIVMVCLLAFGGAVGFIIATASGLSFTVFTFFALLGVLTMLAGLILILRWSLRSQEKYRDQEVEDVTLSAQGLTLRGVGPIPWTDFGPAERRMVPAERNSGHTRRAVMALTPSGAYHVNQLLAPELRPRISPPMGPVWNRHHRYIYAPGVEGLKEEEVIRLINTAREMFGASSPSV